MKLVHKQKMASLDKHIEFAKLKYKSEVSKNE